MPAPTAVAQAAAEFFASKKSPRHVLNSVRRVLVGFGLAALTAIPLVKWVIRNVPMAAAKQAAAAALEVSDPEDVDAALRQAIGTHIDLRLVDPLGALPGHGRVISLPNPSAG